HRAGSTARHCGERAQADHETEPIVRRTAPDSPPRHSASVADRRREYAWRKEGVNQPPSIERLAAGCGPKRRDDQRLWLERARLMAVRSSAIRTGPRSVIPRVARIHTG